MSTENLTAEKAVTKSVHATNGNGHPIVAGKNIAGIGAVPPKPRQESLPTENKGAEKAKKQTAIVAKPAGSKPVSTKKNAKNKTVKPARKSMQYIDGLKAIKPTKTLKITFRLKFHTSFGQNLFITGNHPLLGNMDTDKAVPLTFFNDDYWNVAVDFDKLDTAITYNYFLRNADGSTSYDWGNDKVFNPINFGEEVLIIDGWNHAGYIENAFYTVPFQNVLLKSNAVKVEVPLLQTVTHTFHVKAPLLAKGQTLCLLGNVDALGNWNTDEPVLMNKTAGDVHYKANLDLTKEQFPIAYKYGVYDVENKRFVSYEGGSNRLLHDSVTPLKHTIVNDAFAVLPNTTWKGAGIAIPVFSLRSNNSFGWANLMT